MVEEHGFTFIGPTPEHIRMMGDKGHGQGKQRSPKLGVPTVPGSRRNAVPTVEEAEKIAAKIGYPILIKAPAGGGGKGMKVATDAKSLK